VDDVIERTEPLGMTLNHILYRVTPSGLVRITAGSAPRTAVQNSASVQSRAQARRAIVTRSAATTKA